MLQTARHCLSPTQPLFLQEFSTPTGLSLLTMSGFCAARPRLLMSSLLTKQAFPFQSLHWTALATLLDSLLLSLLHRLSSLRKSYGPWVLSPSPSSSPHPYLARLICSQDVCSQICRQRPGLSPVFLTHVYTVSPTDLSQAYQIHLIQKWTHPFSPPKSAPFPEFLLSVAPTSTQWLTRNREVILDVSLSCTPTSNHARPDWQLLTPKYLSNLSSSPIVGYHHLLPKLQQQLPNWAPLIYSYCLWIHVSANDLP